MLFDSEMWLPSQDVKSYYNALAFISSPQLAKRISWVLLSLVVKHQEPWNTIIKTVEHSTTYTLLYTNYSSIKLEKIKRHCELLDEYTL